MKAEEIAQGRKLEAAAKPEPWSAHEDCELVIVSAADPDVSLLGLDKQGTAIVYDSVDHALILWLRNHAKRLLDDAARLAQILPDYDACLTAVVERARERDAAIARYDECVSALDAMADERSAAIARAQKAEHERNDEKITVAGLNRDFMNAITRAEKAEEALRRSK